MLGTRYALGYVTVELTKRWEPQETSLLFFKLHYDREKAQLKSCYMSQDADNFGWNRSRYEKHLTRLYQNATKGKTECQYLRSHLCAIPDHDLFT